MDYSVEHNLCTQVYLPNISPGEPLGLVLPNDIAADTFRLRHAPHACPSLFVLSFFSLRSFPPTAEESPWWADGRGKTGGTGIFSNDEA